MTLFVRRRPDARGSASVPEIVTTLTARARDGQVDLSWEASDGYGFAVDYLVEYRTTSGPGAWSAPIATSYLALAVTGLTNGVSYDFTVAARTSSGTSNYSVPVVSATPAVAAALTFRSISSADGQNPTLTAPAGAVVGDTLIAIVCTNVANQGVINEPSLNGEPVVHGVGTTGSARPDVYVWSGTYNSEANFQFGATNSGNSSSAIICINGTANTVQLASEASATDDSPTVVVTSNDGNVAIGIVGSYLQRTFTDTSTGYTTRKSMAANYYSMQVMTKDATGTVNENVTGTLSLSGLWEAVTVVVS